MNGDFLCESADFDASFIQLTNSLGTTTYTPDSVVALHCDPTGLADEFTIYLNSKLTAGSYYLTFKTGNDGNTLVAECGFELTPLNDTISIVVDSTLEANLEGSQDSLGNPKFFIDAKCGQTRLFISMDDRIKCNSIESTGSDFLIMDSNTTVPTVVPIDKAYPTVCTFGYTRDITIDLKNPIEGGRFTLFLKNGNDGNTLLNECSKPSTTQFLPIISEHVDTYLGPDFTYCENTVFFAELDAGPGFVTYKWNDGSINRILPIVTEGIYSVEVQNAFGCIDRDTIVVTEIDCFPGIGENTRDWFELYPNPVRDIVYVELKEQLKIEKLQITDTNGKLIEEFSPEAHSKVAIDLSEYENGLYFVSLVRFDGDTRVTRLVVSH